MGKNFLPHSQETGNSPFKSKHFTAEWDSWQLCPALCCLLRWSGELLASRCLTLLGLMSRRQSIESDPLNFFDPESSLPPGCEWLLPSFASFHHSDKRSLEGSRICWLVYCCNNTWQVLCSCLLSSCHPASYSSEQAWTVIPTPISTTERGVASHLRPWSPALVWWHHHVPSVTLLCSVHDLALASDSTKFFPP